MIQDKRWGCRRSKIKKKATTFDGYCADREKRTVNIHANRTPGEGEKKYLLDVHCNEVECVGDWGAI